MEASIRTAQVVGLTSSTFLSGIYFSSSHLFLPIIHTRSPSISTPIFSELYFRGAVTVVPMALFSALCSAYVAYELPHLRGLYAVAGAATFATLPWTTIVMMGVNNRLNLLARDEREREKAGESEVKALLTKWTAMNFVRSGLAMAGGLAGLTALLEVLP